MQPFSPLIVAVLLMIVGVVAAVSPNGQTRALEMAPEQATQITVTFSGSMTNLSGQLSYDGTNYTLTVGPSITPACCSSGQNCAVPMYLILYQLYFVGAPSGSQTGVARPPTLADNGRLITVTGTITGQSIFVDSWSYYTAPSCVTTTSTAQSSICNCPAMPSNFSSVTTEPSPCNCPCTTTLTFTHTSGQPWTPMVAPPFGTCEAFVTVPPNEFPSPPQSLSDVPRFLSQFWSWVSCQFFGYCS